MRAAIFLVVMAARALVGGGGSPEVLTDGAISAATLTDGATSGATLEDRS
jgi:hypothetical protein